MNIRLLGVYALLSILLPLVSARAQSATTPPVVQTSSGTELNIRQLPESLSQVPPLPIGVDNISMLSQVGNSNTATFTQLGDANIMQVAVFGSYTTTTLTQQGNRNTTAMRLTGNNNPVQASQRGNDNQYDLHLTGSGTEISLAQQGNNNRVISNLIGDSRQYGVSQVGNNNELTQRESAATVLPKGYNVEMRGSGINLTIEQGRMKP